MLVFLKNIFRSIKSNRLSVFSLIFFNGVISTVYASASNLSNNLLSSVNQLNQKSRVHDLVINENYQSGNAKFHSSNTNSLGNSIISGISSTAVRYFYKVNNEWKLSDNPVPIRIKNGRSPSRCVPIGGAFPSEYVVYNFLDPSQIKYEQKKDKGQNGTILWTPSNKDTLVIDATPKCGVNGLQTAPVKLYRGAPGNLGEDFEYILQIFDKPSVKANESGIFDTGFQDGYLLTEYLDVSSANDEKRFLINLESSNIDNTLSPLEFDVSGKNHTKTEPDWTFEYRYFYDFFKNNNPNHLDFDITSVEKTQAKKLIEDFNLSSSLSRASLDNLQYKISELIKAKKKTKSSDKDYNPLKFSQIFLKLIFHDWKEQSKKSDDLKLDTELNNLKENKMNSFTGYLGTNSTEWSSLNDDQKYIFSATNSNNRAGMIDFWSAINDSEKQAILQVAKSTIYQLINQETSKASNQRIADIFNFINNHKMWDLTQSLDNFVFKGNTYRLTRKRTRSLLINDVDEDNSLIDDKSNGLKNNTFTYKLINAAPQGCEISLEEDCQQFVDRLNIISGNDLFHDNSYDDYQVLRSWLKHRQDFKQLSSAVEIPFAEMVLRAKFSNPDIRNLFQRWLNILKNDNHGSALSAIDEENIAIYKDQIEQGNWSYNGYNLELSFITVENFWPLKVLGGSIQQIIQVPAPAYIDNKSSNFVVLSPQFAQLYHKKPISDDHYLHFQELINSKDVGQEQWDRDLQAFLADPKNKEHIIRVGKKDLVIVGIGMRSDFAFPSVSILNIIPDPEREALVFVNDYGYNQYLQLNPVALQENYIGVIYPQDIIDRYETAEFQAELQRQMRTYNSNQIVYNGDDYNITFSASGIRISFVNKIVAVLNLVSYLLITLVSLLLLFGVIVLIRRYVKNNSMIFGNLCANGVSKLSIILSTSLFVFIPAIIGPLIGYFVGLFSQAGLFKILKNYWFLPSIPTSFNFFEMLSYILVPMGILSIVAMIVAAITLKASPLVLMRENPTFSQSKFSLKVNNLFNKLLPIWKFRLIVATNSMPRILLLSSMSSLLIVIMIFVLGNIGQFQTVAERETQTRRNGFEIYYRTPSDSSIQDPIISYPQLGQTYLNNIEQKVNIGYQIERNKSDFAVQKIKFNKDHPLLAAANITNFFQDNNPEYLNNFFSEKNKNLDDAIYKLNDSIHLKPETTNFWAKDSILTNFLLRSTYDSDKKYYKSVPLPTPNESKQKIFYKSSLEAFGNNDQDLNQQNTNDSNLNDILEQASHFTPDISSTYADNFYYADYVPVVDEKYSGNKSPDPNANKQTSTAQTGPNGQKIPVVNEDTLILAPDQTPLFQPLIDLYRNKKPILKNNNNGSGDYQSWTSSDKKEYNGGLKTENQDFKEFTYTPKNNGISGTPTTVKMPLLNRLYRDNANYWLLSIDDRNQFNGNLGFFKNRVLIKLLLDNSIKVNEFGLNIKVNLWDIISSILKKANPAVLNQINDNNIKLIRRILNSRYAPYFINRFMTLQKTKKIENFVDGDMYNGNPSFLIRQQDLKQGVNFDNNSRENKITTGLYFLDSNKTTYIYIDPLNSKTGPSYRYGLFALLRPDFLYFVYALLNDPAFSTPATGPTKLVFGNQPLMGDYNNPAKTWETTGDPEQDAEQLVGLTANDPKTTDEDYAKIPGGDQTFTFLSGHFGDNFQEQKVFGLKQDRRGTYLKLLDQNNHSLNHLLYTPPLNINNRLYYPLIVNRYSARKYNLDVGSYITFHLSNTATSKGEILAKNGGRPSTKTTYFKVVGINESFYKDAFFTAQKNANEMIGINPDYGFNAIFTKTFNNNELPLEFTQALNIYSESGVYSAIEFNPNSASGLEIFSRGATSIGQGIYLQSPSDYLQKVYNLPSEIKTPQDYLKLFASVYGNSPLLPGISNISDASVANKLFNNLSTTLETIVIIILVVFLPLLIIMVLMITSLVIDDLKHLSTIMIMLGFNNWENSVTVLTYLLPVFLFSILIGVPLSTLFTSFYVSTIFSSLLILLPIKLLPWHFFTGSGSLLSIFIFAFVQSFLKLKYIYLPVAMKSTGF